MKWHERIEEEMVVLPMQEGMRLCHAMFNAVCC